VELADRVTPGLLTPFLVTPVPVSGPDR
jgi:hypothetical protein